MIIKIDKQKVVDAAEKEIERMSELAPDRYTNDKKYLLKKVLRMCKITQDRSVLITDEDVELLGL